ncbi:MAG: glucose-1-phosphate thymidylyltransferase [Flavobacteriales bacterium]|jgi:UDP-N-acetylglucosamine diphosphorylase/glucosamine-1-phosphate N-acetyltransferase|nr:MAG: glucose-1-phosphate thymidylyltransferase [Flavobacteriales bacterium]
MSIILSDAGLHRHLLPLTYTRPVGQLRPGILRISEGWYVRSGLSVGHRTESYLEAAYPLPYEASNWEVDGGLFPTNDLVRAVLDLRPGEVLVHEGRALAFGAEGKGHPQAGDWAAPPSYLRQVVFAGEVIRFERPWHLFQHCGRAIAHDFDLLTEGRRSQRIAGTNTIIGDPNLIFLEEGAMVEASILNTKSGPIYLGKGAEVMEGCMLRGPIVIGDHAQVKMGAKIYGPSAFGPECRMGGEITNSVILGYSNKGHDGFLGNSVLGEWCNLGADTNTSNLKNTYGNVQVWSGANRAMADTGLQFCGLLMGDHSKSGINTMFNTGTVVGVAANVFGGGFPPKHIPGFSWGGAGGFEPYDIERALVTARRVMERRHMHLNTLEEAVLRHVCDLERAAVR